MTIGVQSFVALVGATVVVACSARKPEPAVPPSTTASVNVVLPRGVAPGPGPEHRDGPDEAAMDRSIDPCEDFYGFACGGWMKATAIPEDEASWVRSFSAIREDNEKALRAILEREARGDLQGDAYGRQLGEFWASCTNEEAIEQGAAADLRAEINRVSAVRDAGSLAVEIAHLHSMGVDAGFDFDSQIDAKDSGRMIAAISQAGLGLPERDYYLRDDSRSRDLRVEYERHVARTLELSGEARPKAAADAKGVVALETELAKASMTNVDLRDPNKVYHRVDLPGLKGIAPDVAWDIYLSELGVRTVAALNVAQPDFMKKISGLARSFESVPWRAYLRWHLASALSPYLSHSFVDEWFRFRQTLTGTKVLQPRWKRCVHYADQLMGEALARPFVRDHLGEDGKRAAEVMVHAIEASMKSDLDTLPWMDGATRARAEEKLDAIVNKIGYPSKWRSYDGLEMDSVSFLPNVLRAIAFEVRRRLTKIGGPVDKEEWEMTPPTVNAYYEATRNQMVFPAGILQMPFYGTNQTSAMNYGAIGMVVGHELTHGFDDQGRQFDAEGNLRDWWTASVGAEFDRRASCVENQYDDYVAIDDIHLKGKLTLGENIADLGGVKLAFAALARTEPPRTSVPEVAGFSPEQQFFMSFAQAWCANYRPEALRLLAATNPHSPPRYRVTGPLSNLPEFAAAFRCKEGSAMVRAAEKTCQVW
ncbi:MAG: M13 family metallopeptidase [Polyangiaceae bacterium]